jgi:hypothetical protein
MSPYSHRAPQGNSSAAKDDNFFIGSQAPFGRARAILDESSKKRKEKVKKCAVTEQADGDREIAR